MQSFFFYFVLIFNCKVCFLLFKIVGWSTDSNWIEIELTKQMYVAGIITQVRPSSYWNQFTTSYNVSYSDNENDFNAIKKVIAIKLVN